MKDEIQSGLKNALERGSSLEDAVQSFIAAGYNPVEVKEAANSLSQSSVLISQQKTGSIEKTAQQTIMQTSQQQEQDKPSQITPILTTSKTLAEMASPQALPDQQSPAEKDKAQKPLPSLQESPIKYEPYLHPDLKKARKKKIILLLILLIILVGGALVLLILFRKALLTLISGSDF